MAPDGVFKRNTLGCLKADLVLLAVTGEFKGRLEAGGWRLGAGGGVWKTGCKVLSQHLNKALTVPSIRSDTKMTDIGSCGL